MLAEDILRHPARVLSQNQREAYFRDGFLVVESLIPEDGIDGINAYASADAFPYTG